MPLSKHLDECCNNDPKFSILPFYKFDENDVSVRLSKENFFIKVFKPRLNILTSWCHLYNVIIISWRRYPSDDVTYCCPEDLKPVGNKKSSIYPCNVSFYFFLYIIHNFRSSCSRHFRGVTGIKCIKPIK